MTDREKLIELLDQCDRCNAEYCNRCEFGKDIDGCVLRRKQIIADTLLANGVTFATDTNVGGKWIPVTERLPEDSVAVNLHTGSGVVGTGFYNKYTKSWVQWYSGGSLFVDVTHWMPLPEPPKGE